MAENLTDILTTDMTQFVTDELKIDLAACIADIKTCKEALARGIFHYSGGSVGHRLSVNTLIQRAIEKELTRRNENATTRKR